MSLRLVEIRSYKLKAGSGARFHELVHRESVPLAREWRMDIVAYGPSLHDPDAYVLVRSFDSLEHRASSQEEFYASEAWRKGPREAIVALIESDWDAVLWLAEEAVEEIRGSHRLGLPDGAKAN